MSEHTFDPCLVLGGGGHAKVVVDALRAAGGDRRLGVLDADPAKAGGSVLDAPILGDDSQLATVRSEGFRYFVVGLGDNRRRRDLFVAATQAGLAPLTVVHPAAAVSPHARLGDGTVVLAAAVVNADARVGINGIVNTASVIEHDCLIGDHVHVAPGARLLGGVAVGDLTAVGAGAVIRQGLRVGNGALVGAGALVLDDVADGVRVAGVPARPLDEEAGP